MPKQASPHRLRIAIAVLLGCLAAAAVTGGWQYWLQQRIGGGPPIPEWHDSFTESALAPEASVPEIKSEAERVTQQLVAEAPESAAALNVRARWKYSTGSAGEAIELWRQALRLDPNLTEPLYALSVVAIENDDHSRALELLERLRLLDSTDVRVPVLLAEALLKGDRVEEARAVLENHIRTQPTSAEALTTLGQICLRQREYEEAIEHFRKAVRTVPDMRPAHYGLGQAYARMGEIDKARKAMEVFQELAKAEIERQSDRAKNFVPRERVRIAAAQTHDDAAKVYRRWGNAEKAEELWRKAVYLDPEKPEYWGQLMTLYEELGRDRRALQVARQLTKVEPENVDHWLNLAALSARVERPKEALAAVRRAVELDPNNPRSREAYELVHESL